MQSSSTVADAGFGWITAGNIVVASIVVALLYAAFMFIVIRRMSPDYFLDKTPSERSWRRQHPVIRWGGHVVKNALGFVFVIAGIAMLVLPGQGLLTILIGLMLLDFPGKRRLELWLVSRRHVRRGIDWIRSRAGRPPLILPDRQDPRS